MKLTKFVLDKILESQGIQGKLADVLGKDISTIKRMADRNDILLTHTLALTVLRDELNCTNEELLCTNIETV